MKMITQGVNATIDTATCKGAPKLIADWLNIEALGWVSESTDVFYH